MSVVVIGLSVVVMRWPSRRLVVVAGLGAVWLAALFNPWWTAGEAVGGIGVFDRPAGGGDPVVSGLGLALVGLRQAAKGRSMATRYGS